ncbi:MAG TPA: CehA/McbA family metallohydrolase [Caulobacteraceae bacterium]|nr:CehA/McbA family metallohydrolase [Caulobacteraceae bacterium]
MTTTEIDAPARADAIVLEGVLTRADHETYKELGFDVPPGVDRITVEFAYTGRDEKAVIDLGLFDPERFRGWSGGDKARFSVSTIDATPSYLPGPIVPGRWTLLLGVPNIRPGREARYVATIRFGRGEQTAVSSFASEPLAVGARWYRGDLHMHTCHSDGSVGSQSGGRSPGPVYKTVESAAAKGVDFIAVTDHNAISHHHALRELQPHFDRLLLIPGVEITTFCGHAGVLGAIGFVEFRLTSRHLPTVRDLQDAVDRQHGLFIVNHPALPSNELCLGCGWTARGTDYARVAAVEVVNGGAVRAQGGKADGPFSGIPFWEQRLNEGFSPTAIGGSDNHQPDSDPAKHPAVAFPTTVVYAEALSERAILDAIRAGRVFIDVEGAGGILLELAGSCGEARAIMGQSLAAPRGSTVAFSVHVEGLAGACMDLVMDGQHGVALGDVSIADADQALSFTLPGDGMRHWIRADVRSADGERTLAIGNPIYLNR